MPRKKNAELRTREYLLSAEVDLLLETAKSTRNGHRNYCLVLLAYRHGLRVEELASLRWSQIDLDGQTIHINRVKSGKPATHPLRGPELRALRKLREAGSVDGYLFASERATPLSIRTIQHTLTQLGEHAGLSFPVHAHMLRHACGYYLANRGMDTRAIQDYLGHRSIQSTVIYTQLSAGRFNDFFDD